MLPFAFTNQEHVTKATTIQTATSRDRPKLAHFLPHFNRRAGEVPRNRSGYQQRGNHVLWSLPGIYLPELPNGDWNNGLIPKGPNGQPYLAHTFELISLEFAIPGIMSSLTIRR